jgi:uncharacterized membrane protein
MTLVLPVASLVVTVGTGGACVTARDRLDQTVQEEAVMAHQDVLTTSASVPLPTVRKIGVADLRDALAKGVDDFWAMPRTNVIFISLIYPVVGLLLARLTFGYDLLPLLFPVAAGFALVGPFAAIWLYELSRRREQGLDVEWQHGLDVFYSRSLPGILALGLLLMTIFVIWVAVAQSIYVANFGYAPPTSLGAFLREVFTTSAGWSLIVVGNAVGFVFAVVALAIGVVSFPLLLDRHVGVSVAMATSVRAVAANPAVMLLWGLIVAALLLIGSLPFLFGLAIVMPILGHATWHLYRKVVDASAFPPEAFREPPHGRRYAAEFPASLFARDHDEHR